MAMFPDDKKIRSGVHLGGPTTLCLLCEAERKLKDRDSDIPYGKLQYKEVFTIANNEGEDVTICMKHLQDLLSTSHYALADVNEYMIVPLSVMEEPEKDKEEAPKEEDVKVETEAEEKPAKETKKKSDKKKESK